jgi:hypothetical protein
MEDVHGVADLPNEKGMQCLLQEFQRQLDDGTTAVAARCRAYQTALQQDSDYVENESFRTMFLRSEELNPSRAARRFVKFFQRKLELFGPTKLTQPITLRDLQEQDLNLLEAGSVQFAKQHDQVGRLILCTFVKQGQGAVDVTSMVSSTCMHEIEYIE